MKKTLILSAISLLLSCSDKESIVEVPKIETINEEKYSISYPKEFSITKEIQGTELIIFIEDKNKDQLRESINLIIKDINLDFNEIIQISLKEFKEYNFNVISSTEVIQSGKKYHRFIYTNELSPNLKLKFNQLIRVQDNKLYILTATCEENKYREHNKIFEQILNSYRVK